MAEIKTKIFVSPVEAFQIVGQESFGPDWDADCILNVGSELRRVALNNLRLALQSGTVQALWYGDQSEHPLTPIEAAGEFFRIDLERNCITLSAFAGEPIRAGIHTDDLKAFLRHAIDASPATTVGAETACRKWIVARIRNGERVRPTAFLWDEARREFPRLSERAFRRARPASIEETGADLNKGGRPRKTALTAET